jgi:hypothetical protein
LVPEVAELPTDVTCKLCKRHLSKLQPDTRVAEYVDAVVTGKIREFVPPPPIIDPESDLPFVSPFTWPTLKRKHHWCVHCPTCSWFNEIEADHNASPWKRHHRLDSERHRWPSVNAALEWYVTLRADGYTVATMGEALAKIGKLGALIRAGGNTQRAQEEADDAHAIDRALNQCYRANSKRGLSRSERLYMLFETARGRKAHLIASDLRHNNRAITALTGPMVAGIAADGRWACYEELRECRLVPRR